VTPTALQAIVLAAGSGRRFGGSKLTAAWRNGALIDGALAAALAAPVRRVIVVTGADPAVGARAPAFEDPRLSVTHAADHALGMSASLRAGLAAVGAGVAGVYIFLGDMPLVPHDIAARLAETLAVGALAAVPVMDGRRGHPALFSAALIPQLAALDGDVGARALLDSLGSRLALVETDDPGILADVDRREDLRP